VPFGSVPASRRSPTDRFHRFCVATVARLPWHLNSVVAPTFLGFALINGLTFGVDLLLLSGLHAPVGPQFAVYLAAVLANYLAFILGLYSAMRWAVFRR
jgi:hypothetical protein